MAIPGGSASPIVNALTINVEDYFQVPALTGRVPRRAWDSLPVRVEQNIDRILALLEQRSARATFFTSGWVAERHPAMVRRIVDAGHELASQGYENVRASDQNSGQLLADLRLSKAILEDVSGSEVRGYRAPAFSIGLANSWAIQCIAVAGYRYSSSIYPTRSARFGVPYFPRFACELLPGFFEVPVSTVRALGGDWPAGGGASFRLLPYGVSSWSIARFHRLEARPLLFHFHAWEVDVEQPPIEGLGAKARIWHDANRSRMERRLVHLLDEFRWDRVDRAYPQIAGGA